MTVAEYIEVLRLLPQDALLVCGGFDESGFDDMAPPQQVQIQAKVSPDWVSKYDNTGQVYSGKPYVEGPVISAWYVG